MASLRMKRYEVAIWRDRMTAHNLPDYRVRIRALTPNGAVSAVLSHLGLTVVDTVLVGDLDHDIGDWLFNVHVEQGQLSWFS